MECEDIESRGIKKLFVFEDKSDSFYAISWGYNDRNEEFLLSAAGQNGAIWVMPIKETSSSKPYSLIGHSKWNIHGLEAND